MSVSRYARLLLRPCVVTHHLGAGPLKGKLHQMLSYRRATVADGGPTLNQHRVEVSCQWDIYPSNSSLSNALQITIF